MDVFERRYRKTCNLVLFEIQNALGSVDPESLASLVQDLCIAENVFFIGVGRVMLSLEMICKRLSHLGISAHCVGDVTEPAITDKDILVVASGSGESIIPVAIAKKAREIGCRRIIHIGSNPNGSMKEYADYMVRIPVQTRLYLPDEVKSGQIMTSLFEQSLLILGDVIAMMMVEQKEVVLEELWKCHANLE